MLYKFHFSNIVVIPTEGQMGEIVILWHADLLNVTEVTLTFQEIHCMIHVLPSIKKWVLLAIYACSNMSHRSVLWENIKNIADSMLRP